MNRHFCTRRAVLEDLTDILSLFQASIQHTCQEDYTEAQIAVWKSSAENQERWKHALASQFFIVAEQNEEIVGFASLENGNYIDFLYVHKDYQRQGIASLLFDTLETEAAKQSHITLWSHVSKTARPFFEQKGFEVLSENYKEVKGIEIMNYWMKKNLVKSQE